VGSVTPKMKPSMTNATQALNVKVKSDDAVARDNDSDSGISAVSSTVNRNQVSQ
jgi:hypothetical protein